MKKDYDEKTYAERLEKRADEAVSSMAGSVSDEHMRDVLNHVHEDMPALVSKEDLWNCVLWIEKKYDDLDHNGVRGL